MNFIADLWKNLAVAWRGLSTNKVRTGLTMLGVVIGVATVIALLSIGEGAQASIAGRITSSGTNLLFVSAGQSFGRGGVQQAGGSTSLTTADAEAIADAAEVPDAIAVSPQYSGRSQVIVADGNVNAQVQGVTASYLSVYDFNVASGRFFDGRDLSTRGTVAVLGAQVAIDLFGAADPVGARIKVSLPGQGGQASGLVPLTVVGVFEAQENSAVFGSAGDTVFVPLTTAQYRLFNGRDRTGKPIVNQITIQAAEGRSADVSAQVDALMRRRRGLTAIEEPNFDVRSQEDLLSLASDVTGTMTAFLGTIALISLVVGGIGIMNIMLVSVTERTREIGIRKAVGARRADILTQFLLEAVVLSVIGGLIGIALGAGVSRLVDYLGLFETSVSPGAVLLAVGFSLAVGLLSGLYPANRAASLQPIEALRYE